MVEFISAIATAKVERELGRVAAVAHPLLALAHLEVVIRAEVPVIVRAAVAEEDSVVVVEDEVTIEAVAVDAVDEVASKPRQLKGHRIPNHLSSQSQASRDQQLPRAKIKRLDT